MLPGTDESYWIDSTPTRSYPPLTDDLHVDVVVIGDGIAGVSTAWELAATRRTVALVEAGRSGHQIERVTGIEPAQSAWKAGDRRPRSRARYRPEPAGVCFTCDADAVCANVCATAVRSRPSAAVRGHPHGRVELHIRIATDDRGPRTRGLVICRWRPP